MTFAPKAPPKTPKNYKRRVPRKGLERAIAFVYDGKLRLRVRRDAAFGCLSHRN